MTESVNTLAALRRRIASLECVSVNPVAARIATGHASLDQMLGGGLSRGRLHELFGSVEDEGAAAGLTLCFAQLLAQQGPLLWLRTAAGERAGGMVYGPGLAALGMAPDSLLIGVMADEAMLLRAAVDALRCPALGALVIELRGRAPLLDLTASRRLGLAAEASGVTALILRIGAEPVPSAADTRWRAAAAPSAPLPGNAPGMSAFHLSLLRQRAGPDGHHWRIVWDNERSRFREANGDGRDERHGLERDFRGQDGGGRDGSAPLSGAVVPLSADRPAADRAA